MDLGEMFRSFVGLRGRRGRDDFPQCDCDCDDHDGENVWDEPAPFEDDPRSEFPFFFGNGSSSLDDMFRHFHGDMHDQMESIHRQMEDMLRGFGTIASEPPMNRPGIFNRPEPHPHDKGATWFITPPEPGNGERKEEEPRNSMLKEDDGKRPESLPSLPAPPPKDSNTFDFTFKNPFRSSPLNPPSQDQRQDTDLDGKVSSANVMDLIKKSDSERQPETRVPPGHGFFSGHSVTMTTVRGPDGKMETKKIVKDSSGREQSTVTRSMDGQTHTITTVMGPEGMEERHEDFKNMDDNDINKFEEKWTAKQAPQRTPQPQRPPNPPMLVPSTGLDERDMDIFSRFFRDPRK